MSLFSWIKKRNARKKIPKYFGRVVYVEGISEIPEIIERDVYIVRRGKKQIWAVFNCPCEQGHRLTVNLSQSRYPFWSAKVVRDSLSLSPSLWLHEDCYSHFWVDDHRIFWVHSLQNRGGSRNA